ncbi:MAG: response regulator transcription factor [Leptospira sp.]|nr:response regulator transcription factor [Leptospira sp.]
MKKFRLYLVDDHVILREGLKHILVSGIEDGEVIGESGDGGKAYEEIDRLKPDMVLLDISLPTMSGIEVARKLRKYHPDMKIIILSRHDNEEYVKELLKYGINGFVLKDDAGEDLLRAVGAVRKNETYLSPRITGHLISNLGLQKKQESGQFTILTNREREILKRIAEGKSNEEIGKALWLSPKTVKVHRQNIMKKLNIHKVTDLVKYAIKSGLVET